MWTTVRQVCRSTILVLSEFIRCADGGARCGECGGLQAAEEAIKRMVEAEDAMEFSHAESARLRSRLVAAETELEVRLRVPCHLPFTSHGQRFGAHFYRVGVTYWGTQPSSCLQWLTEDGAAISHLLHEKYRSYNSQEYS